MDSSSANIYVACWASFCIVALVLLLSDAKRLLPEWRQYLRFLTLRWKLAIFIPAFLFVTVAGHFTDDETWDIVTGAGMSLLAFFTAPWCLGVLFQVAKGIKPRKYLLIVIAITLFSSSWFYDGYLYCRDGHYTVRWLGNLILAPIVYVAAGLLWNLETKNRFFPSFSFFRSDWPAPPEDTSVRPLIPVMLVLILIAASLLISYVHWHW